MVALTLDLSPILTLTRADFRRLCAGNPDLNLERSATGELIVMSPTGGETGNRNSVFNLELRLWNRKTQSGMVFDSSTGFELPNGGDREGIGYAVRSPDLAWIPQAKWDALTPEQRRGFLPLCPDFVLELLSPSDSWAQGQKKMEEYQQNGCRLGWLIDPKRRQVAIYRINQPKELLDAPDILSGEDVLAGFELDARFLWQGM